MSTHPKHIHFAKCNVCNLSVKGWEKLTNLIACKEILHGCLKQLRTGTYAVLLALLICSPLIASPALIGCLYCSITRSRSHEKVQYYLAKKYFHTFYVWQQLSNLLELKKLQYFFVCNKRWRHISLFFCHSLLRQMNMKLSVMHFVFFVSKDSQIILKWKKKCWNSPPYQKIMKTWWFS